MQFEEIPYSKQKRNIGGGRNKFRTKCPKCFVCSEHSTSPDLTNIALSGHRARLEIYL